MLTFRVAAAGVVPIQVTLQCVPSTSDADHHMTAQYLYKPATML